MRETNEEIRGAIRNLRLQLGNTQQTFGDQLGVTIVSICRWERDRLPNMLGLIKLERLAKNQGFSEYAAIFQKAINRELDGRPGFKGAPPKGLPEPQIYAAIEKLNAAIEKLNQTVERIETILVCR